MTIHFADGTQTRYTENRKNALRVIAQKYTVEVTDLVTECDGARELVWLDEASAENDDGANACAEIGGRK